MDRMLELLEITARAAGFGESQGIGAIIGGIIAVVLSFLGVIFLCLILYAGFIWMTSAGNEQKVRWAQKTIQNAVIGVIIVLSAYSITSFVLRSVTEATM